MRTRSTHALLDGIHRRFNEPSNPDVLAFHEAFADIVALFQHFSLPEVLRHQIAYDARGPREPEPARRAGAAVRAGDRQTRRAAQRDRRRRARTPEDYRRLRAQEPHERGSILVAAVFDAFLTIYKARIADLLRIASEGTGVLPDGQLHPDLVSRLAEEAACAAQHVLEMCIRALDYCPPVDITFGDYLRAIVTADYEFDPDRRAAPARRLRRGVPPPGDRAGQTCARCRSTGCCGGRSADAPDEDEDVVFDLVKSWAADISSWNITQTARALRPDGAKRAALHEFLVGKLHGRRSVLSGIDPSLKFEVHSIRPSLRIDWDEQPRLQWVIELTQRIPQDARLTGRSATTSAAAARCSSTPRPGRFATASRSHSTTRARSGSGATCSSRRTRA